MKVYSTIICMILVTFISVLGMALPYPIITPMLLSLKTVTLFNTLTFSPVTYLGLVIALYPLGTFCGSYIIGYCADKYGRKRMIVYPLIGTCLCYLLSGLSISYQGYTVFIILRFLSGIFESNISLTLAVASDISKSISKRKSFSYMTAANYMAYLVGPLLGGYLGYYSYGIPFYIAGGLTILTIILVSFLYHEIQNENKKNNKTKIFSLKFLNYHKFTVRVLIISLLTGIATMIFYQFYPMYLVQILSFSSIDIANITVVLNIGLILTSLFVFPLLSKVFKDEIIMISSLILYLILTFSLLFVGIKGINVYLLFFIQGILIGLNGIVTSILISNYTSPEEQAQARGFKNSISSLVLSSSSIIISQLIIFSAYAPIYLIISLILISIFIYSNILVKSNIKNKKLEDLKI